MQAIVINLAAATERLAFQAAQLQRLGLAFNRLEAVRAEDAAALRPPAYWDTWERPLKDAEKACLLSHRTAWQRIAAADAPMLVLEDDAVLSDKVPALLGRLPDRRDIDLLTLETRGRKKLLARPQADDDLPIRRLYQDRSGAAAYVLWPEGARLLLARTAESAGLADAVICAAYALRAFQADPALALQTDRCAAYAIPVPVTTASSIDTARGTATAAADYSAPQRGAFKARRIAAQLRMGLRQLRYALVAERCLVRPDPRDFIYLQDWRNDN